MKKRKNEIHSLKWIVRKSSVKIMMKKRKIKSIKNR